MVNECSECGNTIQTNTFTVYEQCLINANSRVNSYLYKHYPHKYERDFHECFRTCISSNECSAFQKGKKKFT